MAEMTPIIDGPADAPATFVFAHGAGAGMETEFMQVIAEGLAEKGIRVIRFEFPYMHRRREDGRKFPPNRGDKLLEAFREVLNSADISGKLFVGGKSMGGRIAAVLCDENSHEEAAAFDIAGLLCLGFPFYPPKKERVLSESRGAFMSEITTPTLILQGERDTFGRQDELEQMALSDAIECCYLPDGDHSFKPRVKSGFTLEQNLSTAIEAMADFIQG